MERATRVLAGALILFAGAVHLDLWAAGYRALPYIGPMFLVSVIGAVVVGLLVALGSRRTTALAGVAFCVVSAVALVLSRTVGLFGVLETWTAPARQTLAAELAAAVLLVITSRTGAARPSAVVATTDG